MIGCKMVPRKAALVLLPVLTLAGCSFVSSSFFPSFLTTTVAELDLSSGVPGYAEDFHLSYLDGGIGPLLFLTVEDPFGGRTIVVEPNTLELLGKATRQEFIAAVVDNGGRFGSLAGIDANADYVLGTFVFQADPVLGLEPFQDLGPNDQNVDPDAHNVVTTSFNNYVVSVDGSTLTIRSFTSGWLSGATNSYFIGNGAYELDDVIFIQDSTGSFVLVTLNERSGERGYVLAFLETDWPGTLPPSPLIDYALLTLDNYKPGSFHVTAEGLVYYDVEKKSWRVLDDEGDEMSELHEPELENDRYIVEFSVYGDAYFVFDPVAEKLYRCAAWW